MNSVLCEVSTSEESLKFAWVKIASKCDLGTLCFDFKISKLFLPSEVVGEVVLPGPERLPAARGELSFGDALEHP
jgi:hypothetical protein